jgi:hypothetical protein
MVARASGAGGLWLTFHSMALHCFALLLLTVMVTRSAVEVGSQCIVARSFGLYCHHAMFSGDVKAVLVL